jgi:hypothetical protein
VGILLVVSAIVLHYVFRLYKAPTDAEFDVLGTFFATFASTILTFFIGALLFDYQVEKTEAGRFKQLKLLLGVELSTTLETLDPDNSSVEVVITHVQPVILEQAIRDGYFDLPHAEAAIRLAEKMRVYGAKTSHLFSILSTQTAPDPGFERLALHAIRDVEKTRQDIFKDTQLLIEHL